MTEPTTALAVSGAVTTGITVAGILSGVDGSALTGAFCGAAVFMFQSKDTGLWARIAYGIVSWAIGYYGAPVLGSYIGVQETFLTGFAVGVLAITVSLTAIQRVKEFDFTRLWKKGS